VGHTLIKKFRFHKRMHAFIHAEKSILVAHLRFKQWFCNSQKFNKTYESLRSNNVSNVIQRLMTDPLNEAGPRALHSGWGFLYISVLV